MLEMLETLAREWKVVRDAPIAFLLCVVAVGAVQWLLLKHFYCKDEAAGSHSQAVVKDSGNATGGTATGGNASSAVSVNVYPPHVQTAVPLPEAKLLVQSPPSLRPLVVLKAGKLEQGTISRDPHNIVWEIGKVEWSNLSGLGYLLPVTFDAEESEITNGLIDVAAHARFTSASGDTINAHSLRWIGEKLVGRCSFRCGETKRLIIGFKAKQDVGVPEDDEKATKIPVGDYDVTVTVVWAVNKKQVLLPFKFSVF